MRRQGPLEEEPVRMAGLSAPEVAKMNSADQAISSEGCFFKFVFEDPMVKCLRKGEGAVAGGSGQTALPQPRVPTNAIVYITPSPGSTSL